MGKLLHKSTWTMTSKLRKQLANTDANRSIFGSAETNAAFMIFAIIMSTIMSLFAITVGFRYYFWYLRSLQMLTHLPMLKVIFPANACRFLEILMPIVSFDIFSSSWTTDVIYDFDYFK